MFLAIYMGFEGADVKKKAAQFAAYIVVALGTSTIRTSIPL